MLKIIGRKSSSNVQEVLWTCAEIKIKYERQDAGREFGVVNTDEFFALNPNRKVPVIIDDGMVLWESNAIVRYLAAKFDMGGLCPIDPKVRADADRWMDWQLSALGPSFTDMFHGLIRHKPEERDWDKINASRDKTEQHLKMLDANLAEKKWVTGDNFSMGDIPVGIYGYRWHAFENVERQELPNLKRWYEQLTERPAFQEFVMVGRG